MKLSKTSLFLLAWLVVLIVAPLLAHAVSPYAGNQGSTTKQTTAPPVKPVTPVSKPSPTVSPYTGTTGDKKLQK